jgi:glutaredoxin-like protein NrdH
MEWKHVEGKNKGDIKLFALSTCIWCKKTKALLNSLGVDYYYIDVDLVEGDDAEVIEKEMEKCNPQISFPTIKIDDSKVILGFNEDEIKKVFNDGNK